MKSERTRSITVRAPGKINVFLRIGASRGDGYHDIASLSQAVSLFDEVTAAPSDTISVRFAGPIDASNVPIDARNLAVRAARRLAEHSGCDAGAELTILKRIPIAGGMGSASADAAAALVACDELWETGLGRAGLLPIAAELGPDVPFALEGGTAVGTGRGDELSPALAQGTFHWVLALFDMGLDTSAVLRALDEHRVRHARDLGPQPEVVKVDTAVLQAVRIGDAASLADSIHNDLQAAAMKLAPMLSELLELGETQGALAGIVSGSGPTVAFLAVDAQSAAELRTVLARAGYRALTATGPVPGARVV